MSINIGCTIIVRETTNYGYLLLKSCIESMKMCKVDQIAVVDNDCSERIKEELLKDSALTVVEMPGRVDFAALRNKSLELLSDKLDYFTWVDSDETFYPDGFGYMRSVLDERNGGIAIIFNTLIHCMITPFQYQMLIPKNNTFKMTKDMHWTLNVHEALVGKAQGGVRHLADHKYTHYGYTRLQIETAKKFLWYAFLEHGNCDAYRREVVDGVTLPYFRNWRTPYNLVSDRSVIKFLDKHPEPFERNVLVPFRESTLTWEQYLRSLDPELDAEISLLETGKDYNGWIDRVEEGFRKGI